jgi:conjugal transfer mating pair stabilization protein TraG
MSRQLGNGGMGTQTRDGSMVWDSSGAMSKLPVDINVGRQIASAQQQMARESDVQAESSLQGYNSSVTECLEQPEAVWHKYGDQRVNHHRGR